MRALFAMMAMAMVVLLPAWPRYFAGQRLNGMRHYREGDAILTAA